MAQASFAAAGSQSLRGGAALTVLEVAVPLIDVGKTVPTKRLYHARFQKLPKMQKAWGEALKGTQFCGELTIADRGVPVQVSLVWSQISG